MHDLVRSYAAGHARQAFGEAAIREAIGRNLDHYLHTGTISSDISLPFRVAVPTPGVVPEYLADETGLLQWARAEGEVLVPGHHSGRRGGPSHPRLADVRDALLASGRSGILAGLAGR